MIKPWKFAKVFGRLIPIFKVKGLIENEGLYGVYEIIDPANNIDQIRIHSAMKGDVHLQTVLHEIFHATLARTNTHFDQEEAVVDQLASAAVENFRLQWRK